MRIIATKVKVEDLKPGDLFSNADQAYFDLALQGVTVGEKVYIRTDTPYPEDQKGDEIYRITIEKDG